MDGHRDAADGRRTARGSAVDSYLATAWNRSNEFVEHELGELKKQYFWMTEDEIKTGLDVLEGSETMFAINVRKHTWVQEIRRMIAEKAMHHADVAEPIEEKTTVNELAEKANQTLHMRRQQKKENQRDGKRQRHGRLKLDDALRQAKENGDPDKAFQGWSEARVKAFKQLGCNANAYFYRFNNDGEEQDRGPWTQEEKELFLKRLEEMGPTQQWGIFSMTIPRRVGYQCSNFYRRLLITGELTDPNYVMDKDGKLHFLFANAKVGKDGEVVKSGRPSASSSKRAQSSSAYADEDGGDDSHADKKPRTKSSKKGRKQKNKKSKKKKKKSLWDSDTDEDDDDESDVEDYHGPVSIPDTSRRMRTRSEAVAEAEFDNLLPDYVDPITCAPVRKPAISKYGHVLGYDTWMKCFNASGQTQGGRCPLTNQKLSKSDITLLTPENIDRFRDKISNLA